MADHRLDHHVWIVFNRRFAESLFEVKPQIEEGVGPEGPWARVSRSTTARKARVALADNEAVPVHSS